MAGLFFVCDISGAHKIIKIFVRAEIVLDFSYHYWILSS